MTREELERKLGQLTYRIGKKMEQIRKFDSEIKSLQVESNNVATEIEDTEIEDLDGE